MTKNEIEKSIKELEEKKKNSLAKGSISHKRIGGEEYFYHRQERTEK